IPNFSLLKPKPYQTIQTQTNTTTLNTNNKIDLKLTLKDLDMITDLFALNMSVAPQTLLTANINPQQDLILNLNSDYFIYDTYIFRDISLNSNANNGLFDNNLKISNINIDDSLSISANDLNLSYNNGKILLKLQAGMGETDNLSTNLDFKGFLTQDGLQGYFSNSYINIAQSTINLNDNHSIRYFDNALSLLNFSLKQNKGSITLNGEISDRPNNKLDVIFKDLDISAFNPILNSFGLNLKGQINQKVILRNILSNFSLTSNLVINDLAVNDINLGKASFNINNALTKEVFATTIKMQYQSQDKKTTLPLSIKGFINTKSKENNLDLKLSMDNLDLKIIEPYLTSLSSDIGGTLYTKDLKIKGPFTQPNISGVLEAKNAHLKIDILNITYDFNDKIYLNNNIFSFKNFTLSDKQKNKIVVNGDITHHNFTDFDLNINAVADKLKILDTDEYSDQMYYGTAFASATADVKGDLNHLNIDVVARTERGTILTVPISSKTSATQNSFIKFITIQDTTSISLEDKIKKEETQGLTYDISVDLNVTPDAQRILPMDFNQLKGDLSAKGNGDLKIALGSERELSLIGGIEIENGQFKMSVMDMMAKTFEIEQGGSLTWTGEPAGGNLDLQAIYKTKASLMPILGSEYSKAVDVQSIIKLTGSMMNPQPKFDIRLPNTDDNTVERLFMNIDRNDEKAMLEQTVSLLFLHQFYSAEGNYENTVMETGISSAFEAAFGQISGMLTDVIRVVDVNMNYSRGTETTSDQFDVNLSRDYGRWVVNVNSSFGTGENVSTATQETNAIIGDAYVEYKMTDAFRVRVFNRSNANDFTKYNISPFTQGVGLFYRKQFDSIHEIFRRKKK
ncbi:MAG: translocation/assembly module TamB domain-containing protein, partial [Bacteroidales bacterium]|nr:translocation/assembly module TamB domain-containing protein [Bacteroidales bacterium]